MFFRISFTHKIPNKFINDDMLGKILCDTAGVLVNTNKLINSSIISYAVFGRKIVLEYMFRNGRDRQKIGKKIFQKLIQS